ncbi:hypothetical protein ACOMHN_055996 [Nucella lapillus]
MSAADSASQSPPPPERTDADDASSASVPPGMTLVVPAKNRHFAFNFVRDFPGEPEKVLVNTADLNAAMSIVREHGRIVICGPPASGKTRLADGIHKVLSHEGYVTMCAIMTMMTCHNHLEHKVAGPRRYTCVEDCYAGNDRLRRESYLSYVKFLYTYQELWDRPPPPKEVHSGVLVITVYPHILREMQMLDESSLIRVADPKVVLHLTKDPLNPDLPLKPDPQRYAMILQEMLHHDRGRPATIALLTQTMAGKSGFLDDPVATRETMRENNYIDVTAYQIAELAEYLRGFILDESGIGFKNRAMYDTAGLALGRCNAWIQTLKVCDVKFFVEYMRMDPDAKTRSTYLVAKHKLDRPLWLGKMYRGLAEEAALMELCLHPSLSYLSIVQEFDNFCSEKKNYTERVMNAEDAQHKLPLMYWSVWNASPHLNHWCLSTLSDGIRKSKVLSEPVLTALLASILFAEAGDSSLALASGLVKELANHKFKTAREDFILNLPIPSLRKEDVKFRLEQVKTRMKVNLCYLEDTRLPLPSEFITVNFTPESISVHLPSKSWYLLLRLLTDKHPEETDEKGNTSLHLAVESGHHEVIKTVARGGASLTAKNRKGMTPYLLAQKAKHQAEKADPSETGSSKGERSLHAACHEGDTDQVKALLCQGASLGEKDRRGNTPLHVACRAGHEEIVATMLKLKVDVNARNAENATPLQEAACSGHHELVIFLTQHGASGGAKSFHR